MCGVCHWRPDFFRLSNFAVISRRVGGQEGGQELVPFLSFKSAGLLSAGQIASTMKNRPPKSSLEIQIEHFVPGSNLFG